MSYTFHEDVSLADVAFSLKGSTLEETLLDAAKATFEVMVKPGQVKPKESWSFQLKEPTPEKLLFSWLEELIYLKDAEYCLLSQFDFTIAHHKGSYTLKATVKGEEINQKKHTMNVDVKAVTYHHFSLEKTKKGWEGFVILDI